MTTIAGIVMGRDENVIRKLRPVIFAFGKYYELAGLYLLSAVLWMAANVYGGAAFAGPWDYELVAYWVILVLPALAAGVLWISKQPLVYAILAGIAGSIALPSGASSDDEFLQWDTYRRSGLCLLGQQGPQLSLGTPRLDRVENIFLNSPLSISLYWFNTNHAKFACSSWRQSRES